MTFGCGEAGGSTGSVLLFPDALLSAFTICFGTLGNSLRKNRYTMCCAVLRVDEIVFPPQRARHDHVQIRRIVRRW